MKSIHKKAQVKSRVNSISIGILAFIVGIIPLIVRLKVIPLDGVFYLTWTGTSHNYDFYSYYKSLLLVIGTIILALTAFAERTSGRLELKKTKYYIPVYFYIGFAIISTLFSKYRSVAISGYLDRYEGLFVIIAYMLILLIAINLVRNEKDMQTLIGVVLFSSVIICLIGLFQFVGMDIFKTKLGTALILPQQYKNIADQINYTLENTMVYSTLYHSNYIGSYVALLLPVCISLFLLLKKRSHKIFTAVVSVLLLVNLLGSRSRGGLVGLAITTIILVILLRKSILQNKIYILSIVGVSIITLLVMNGVTKGAILNKVISITSDPRIVINEAALTDIDVDGNKIDIYSGKQVLRIFYDEGEVFFKDSNDAAIKMDYTDGVFRSQDERYEDYSFMLASFDKGHVLEVYKKDINMNFLITENGFRFLNDKGDPVELRAIEKVGFEGKESLGSSRGYIWSRSLPLLKKTWLVGFGPDTFAMYFPQDDYVGKLVAYGNIGVVVDKPHNLYLQTAINTGIISLLALLSIFIMYIISSLKLYIKNEFEDIYSIVGVAVFLGVCGYLGAGLFNDSVVSVSPIFWGLLGIGIGINLHLTSSK